MRRTFLPAVAVLGLAAFAHPAPSHAEHVAGGVIAEYNDIDIALIAGGWSTVELLRGNVYNDLGDFVGYVHDAIVLPNGDTTFVIVNVAGFLNIGHKLVALPAVAFEINDNGDMVLPNATKDALNALPKFRYAK